VTGKHADGGGSGGTHADSSAKTDVASDQRVEDARRDAPEGRDAPSGKDMSLADARGNDAGSKGGAGGGGGMNGGGVSGGAGAGGGGTGGQCQSNGDCVLYPKLGSGCCGVCQPKSDPQPPPVQCLIACLNPLVSCGCVNQQCVGSTKQL
jgi:hypothetical protein